MEKTDLNIIQRVVFDIGFNGNESGAKALQNRFLHPANGWLVNSLEKGLDQHIDGENFLCINRIEIDAGEILPDDVERVLPGIIESELAVAVKKARSDRSIQLAENKDNISKSAPEKLTEAFLCFLETGTLPWSFRLNSGETLEMLLINSWSVISSPKVSGNFINDILRALASGNSLKRLLFQFSGRFILLLIELLSKADYEIVMRILNQAEEKNLNRESMEFLVLKLSETAIRQVIAGRHVTVLSLLESISVTEPVSLEPAMELSRFISGILKQIRTLESRSGKNRTPDDSFDTTAEKPGRREEDYSDENFLLTDTREVISTDEINNLHKLSQAEKIDSVYIENAGLVILHPFLQMFFESLMISGDGKLISPDRAACLVQFLATGNSCFLENEMALPKILCGLPVSHPIDTRVIISENEKKESTSLLKSVIRHWAVLKETSCEGMRTSFLLRSGKLEFENGKELFLRVEQRSYDMLLDSLPWSISMIKLPWMDYSLRVEWTG